MAVQLGTHPSADTLHGFALGKLDDRAAAVIMSHIDGCPDCCGAVAGLSGDDFVDRLRQAHGPGARERGARDQGRGTRDEGRETSEEGSDTLSSRPAPFIPLPSFPQYEVLRELGRGGMGIVYLAKNKLMDRLEVLKVVSKALLDRPGAVERFLREIRSAAKLNHFNVVTAYSAVQSGELLAFAMEYVEGEDLAELVQTQGPLPVAQACDYVQQAALGLQHAFEKQMVHRDIKPQNLILAREGLVKILDFGLAKVTSCATNEDTGLTDEGAMLGTPDYVAPEQTLDAANADIRADIYSLGCTLYYLLTGAAPFTGRSRYEVLQAHQSMEAKPLRLGHPEVPEQLAVVVRKMMAKDPAQRYQTPLALVQALAPFVGEPWDEGRGASEEREARGEGQGARDVGREPRVSQTSSLAPRPSSLTLGGCIAGGVLLIGLLALGASGVFRVNTPEGTLVVEVNVPNPDVYVDGRKMTVRWDKGGKKAEIRVPAGTRAVEVTKDGFAAFGKQVSLSDGGSRVLKAHLETRGARDEGRGTSEEGRKAAGFRPSPLTPRPSSRAGDERNDNALKLKLCWCPTGTTPAFWMGKYEVTQSEWAGLMGSMPSHALNKGKGNRYPIYYVSHADAAEFCRKLTDLERKADRLPKGWSYRLPTDEQWVYACRAGTTGFTAFGDTLSSTQANFNGDWPFNGAPKGPHLGKAVEVGSFRPNAWGIYDMHGNVGEFTAKPGRHRGGSWCDSGRNCCSEIFIPDPPDASEHLGFRVALIPSNN